MPAFQLEASMQEIHTEDINRAFYITNKIYFSMNSGIRTIYV